MKQIIASAVLACIVTSVFAQNENDEKEKGFKKENLFTGGSITASFYSGGTILGANPMFGYKLANWVDAGVSLNYVYSSSLDYYGNKIDQQVLGPGVFTRIYPLSFLYLEGQFEHNFISQKFTDPSSGTKFTDKVDANSFLVGAGFAEGRRPGSNTFFYVSILVDVIKDPNSPYVIDNYDNSGRVISTDLVPVIRAGINIGLFQGKNKHNENNDRSNGHRQPKYYND
jgi:hypothetical protein